MDKTLESRDSDDAIIDYLESVLTKKLKPNKASTSKRRDKFKLRQILPFGRDRGRSTKHYASTPIIVPDNFLDAIKQAKPDLKEIENHAQVVGEIVNSSGASLKFCEEYFQLRLDAHLGREEVLYSINRFVIFF